MGNADSGGDLVHILAARPTGTHEGDDVQIRFGDFSISLSFIEFGDGRYRRKTGLALILGVERTRADQAMYPGLIAQIAKGIIALNVQGDVLQPGLFAPLAIDFTDVPPSPLEEIEVHPKQHLD